MRINGVMSNGKFEGLTHITNARSQFTMVATDQRGSLRRMIDPQNPAAVTRVELQRVKQALIHHLAGTTSPGRASGVLVDPEYSVARGFLETCAVRADVGLLIGVEASGYGGAGEWAPAVQIFNEFTPEAAVRQVKGWGAAAVKMLIYYRPDSPTRRHQEAMVTAVGQACEEYAIPFLLEPVSHALKGGPSRRQDPAAFSQLKPDLVVETARELTKPEYGVDVLKAEFPLNLRYAEALGQDPAEACKALDEASQIPWVILSAGVDFPEFVANVEHAVANGASGFLGGRAIWKEAVGRDDIDHFLQTTSVARLNQLAAIAEQHAAPWYTKYASALSQITVTRGE